MRSAARLQDSSIGVATSQRFFTALESMRGLAALTVVVYHASWSNPISSLHFFRNGALMVDLFFVLSGFVIFHSYGRRLGGPTAVGRFLLLRLGRLYPLHLTFLGVFLLFELAKLAAQVHYGIVADKPAFTVNGAFSLFTNVLLIHSLGFNHSLTYNYPSWSISAEYFAYVVFAVVRNLCPTFGAFTVAATSIVVLSALILLGAGVGPLADAGPDRGLGFFRCCVGFFLGTLVYLLYAEVRASPMLQAVTERRTWVGLLAPAGTIGFLCCVDPNGPATHAMPVLAAASILSVVLIPCASLQTLLHARPLRWLGRVSYSVYMVHACLVWTITQILTVGLKYPKITVDGGHGVDTPTLPGLGALLVLVAATLLLSELTYRAIEEPFRQRSRELTRRWFSPESSKSDPRATGAA